MLSYLAMNASKSGDDFAFAATLAMKLSPGLPITL